MQNDAPPDDSADDDFELFRREMQGVEPLKPNNRVTLPRPKPPARRPRANAGPDSHQAFAPSDFSEAAPEILSFCRSGVQPATFKKLRQGKLAIEAQIDLHGLTAEQAGDYLDKFLQECHDNQTRVALMVHGKGYRSKGGQPIIKTQLNRWLRECPQVLAFHSAQPRDGGSGAVYVLLKKPGVG